jgi:peptide/nickel transport system permease protein
MATTPANPDPSASPDRLGTNVTLAGIAGSSEPLEVTPDSVAAVLAAEGLTTPEIGRRDRWAQFRRAFFAPYNPSEMGVGLPAAPPSAQHLLGTTRVGQDIFSEMLYGTRASILVGFGVGIFATLVALFIGMTAGYIGGWTDEIMMLITNIFLTLPALPLIIVISTYAAAFNLHGLGVIIGVLSFTGWAFGARVKRSQTLSLRNKDFVMAARVAGEPWYRIVFVEILPNMLSLIVSQFIFTAIFAVLGEASLEYLGLGDINQVTWGTILYWAQNNAALITDEWYWFLPPGLAIGIFSLGLALINYAIDEMTNPRLRVQKMPRGYNRNRAGTGAPEASPTGATTDATVA